MTRFDLQIDVRSIDWSVVEPRVKRWAKRQPFEVGMVCRDGWFAAQFFNVDAQTKQRASKAVLGIVERYKRSKQPVRRRDF